MGIQREIPRVVTIDSNNEEKKVSEVITSDIVRMIPVEDKEKQESLKRVLWYLSAIIYGDEIHSFSAHTYHTKYALEAISELVKCVQLNSIENFGVIINNLRQELDNLQSEKLSLSEEVSKLEEESSELKEELDTFNKEKQELESYRNALSKEIEELKCSLENYERQILNYGNEESIVWESIDENHPIYGLGKESVNAYLTALISDYSHKTGLSLEDSGKDFMLQTPALFRLVNFMKHGLCSSCENMTVREIAESNFDCFNYSLLQTQKNLKSILRDVKVFKVVKGQKNNMQEVLNNTETKDALRELGLYKELLEAKAKQRIAEQQLEMVINALDKNMSSEEILNCLKDEPSKKLIK